MKSVLGMILNEALNEKMVIYNGEYIHDDIRGRGKPDLIAYKNNLLKALESCKSNEVLIHYSNMFCSTNDTKSVLNGTRWTLVDTQSDKNGNHDSAGNFFKFVKK